MNITIHTNQGLCLCHLPILITQVCYSLAVDSCAVGFNISTPNHDVVSFYNGSCNGNGDSGCLKRDGNHEAHAEGILYMFDGQVLSFVDSSSSVLFVGSGFQCSGDCISCLFKRCHLCLGIPNSTILSSVNYSFPLFSFYGGDPKIEDCIMAMSLEPPDVQPSQRKGKQGLLVPGLLVAFGLLVFVPAVAFISQRLRNKMCPPEGYASMPNEPTEWSELMVSIITKWIPVASACSQVALQVVYWYGLYGEGCPHSGLFIWNAAWWLIMSPLSGLLSESEPGMLQFIVWPITHSTPKVLIGECEDYVWYWNCPIFIFVPMGTITIRLVVNCFLDPSNTDNIKNMTVIWIMSMIVTPWIMIAYYTVMTFQTPQYYLAILHIPHMLLTIPSYINSVKEIDL